MVTLIDVGSSRHNNLHFTSFSYLRCMCRGFHPVFSQEPVSTCMHGTPAFRRCGSCPRFDRRRGI